jgi:tyrosyl-tRNA synthetase
MFNKDNNKLKTLENLDDNEILEFRNAMWGFSYENENLFETIVKSGLAKSNGEARHSISSWAIYINEEKISDFNYDFDNSFINNKVILLRKGKKNFRIISK